MSRPVVISAAVEGLIDQAVARRLAKHVGAAAGSVYGRRGKFYIRDNLRAYNNAAQDYPWLVLVDLDETDCAPSLRYNWLPRPGEFMCFRVAVREVESWLLADQERIAGFLQVPLSSIPENPEDILDAKEMVVELAAMSNSWEIMEDIVPRPGGHRKTGPAYNSRMIEFVQDARKGWRPDVAAENAESLARCIRCLEQTVKAYSARSHEEMKGGKRQPRLSEI